MADNLCVTANAHLWIIDSQDEFDLVTDFYGLKKVKQSLKKVKQSLKMKNGLYQRVMSPLAGQFHQNVYAHLLCT